MKKYFLFLSKIIAAFIFASVFVFINLWVYKTIFDGFPYPILTFSFLIITFWFIVITLTIFIFSNYLNWIDLSFLELAILICGVFGILALFQLQLEQKSNQLYIATTRFEHSKFLLTSRINQLDNIANERIANNVDEFLGYKRAFYIYHRNKLDSIVNDTNSTSIISYLNDLKQQKYSDFFIIDPLIVEVELYSTNKINLQKAKAEFEEENKKDYNFFYLFYFLSALILGFIRLTISYVKNEKRI